MMGGLNDAEQPAAQPWFSLVEKPPESLEANNEKETVSNADMTVHITQLEQSTKVRKVCHLTMMKEKTWAHHCITYCPRSLVPALH